jgi:hypothetical protein
MIHLRLYSIFLTTITFLLTACSHPKMRNGEEVRKNPVPVIDGNWWQVAQNPDLDDLTSPEQQPVDFGIWQALDGTWQIWSCIRKTKELGHTRLFYRWEGKTIMHKNWVPMGIAMRADTTLGETEGGLQAPFVIQYEGKFRMFYGDWNHICLAESNNGKQFKRLLRDNRPVLFGDSVETNTRDPMVIRVKDRWYCYYTAHPDNDGAIYIRSSGDLLNWSDSKIVSHGGSPGSGKLWLAECPHTVQYNGKFYLFRTYSYGEYENGKQVREPQTNIYCSEDPENFGIDTDSLLVGKMPVAAPEIIHYEGHWYIAALMPDLQGIHLARLKWIEQ